MFSIFANESGLLHGRPNRRQFLQIGTLAFGGLTLSQLLALRQTHGASGNPVVRDRAVIMLFLDGGPPQMETFDPKPDAPLGYRSMVSEIPTALPGVTFGEHFPRLAKLADRLSIVRSFSHGIHRHGSAMRYFGAGGNPTKAHMGSAYARIAGLTHPETGIPRNILVHPGIYNDKYNVPIDRIAFTGNLSPAYLAFDPSGGSNLLGDMSLNVPEQRLADRRQLLTRLDHAKRSFESTSAASAVDEYQEQAAQLILGGMTEAFDLSQEDPKTLERYDTTVKVPSSAPKYMRDNNPSPLGRQLLLARRLVESGAGFITVRNHGWDFHGADGGGTGVPQGMPILGPAVDKAASALIEDLDERGLSDKVLVIITGEFGRMPKIEYQGGRNHWGHVCPLVFFGGGLPRGVVVGSTDRIGEYPDSDPVSMANVYATIFHSLLDLAELRVATDVPTELLRSITESTPIPQLT